jgi:hypothetical protein
MKRIQTNDRTSYAITRREYTDEGFLKVPGQVARTGIQQYLASELELTDRAPNDIVNVYRPASEVFAQESLDSYLGADVTNDHPNELINTDTYKAVTTGVSVSAGRATGDFVEVDVIIKDADSIKAVESGKVQLSAGYRSFYDASPGVTPDGVEYEFIQRDIRINHIALVDRARAGFNARLHDNHPNEKQTMKRVSLDSGRSVEIENEATATLVNDSIERLTKRIADAEFGKEDAEKEAKDAEEEKVKAEAAKDMAEEETKAEKAKSTDAAISARILVIGATNDSARLIAGVGFKCDSLDSLEIKRQALAISNDSLVLTDKPDAYIEACFDMAVQGASAAPVKTVDAQRILLSKDGLNDQVTKPTLSARDNAKTSLDGAWKKTTGEG